MSVKTDERPSEDDDYEFALTKYKISRDHPKLYTYMLKAKELYANRSWLDRVKSGRGNKKWTIENMIPVMYERLQYGPDIPEDEKWYG